MSKTSTAEDKPSLELYPRPVQVFQNEVVQVAIWLLFDRRGVRYHYSLHLIGLNPGQRGSAIPNVESIPRITEALDAGRKWVEDDKKNPESVAARLRLSLEAKEPREHVC